MFYENRADLSRAGGAINESLLHQRNTACIFLFQPLCSILLRFDIPTQSPPESILLFLHERQHFLQRRVPVSPYGILSAVALVLPVFKMQARNSLVVLPYERNPRLARRGREMADIEIDAVIF